MPYVTDKDEFSLFSDALSPLANFLLSREGSEEYYVDPFVIFSGSTFQFLRALATKGGDNFYYFYDYSVENQEKMLTQYIEQLQQYPLIRIPNSFNEDMIWEDFNRILPCFGGIKNYQRNSFIARESSQFIIAGPSLKWYIYADREVEIAKLTSFIGLPNDPKEPHYGFLNKTDAEKEISKHMKWKYSM